MKSIKLIELVEDVKTLHESVTYVIHVTEEGESGILGVCPFEDDTIKIVKSMGISILKDLEDKIDPNWTKINIISGPLSYCIKIQKLGRIRNGKFKTYATVEAEMVQNIWPSR